MLHIDMASLTLRERIQNGLVFAGLSLVLVLPGGPMLLALCLAGMGLWSFKHLRTDLAKALAMRNPEAALSNQAAAGLKLQTGTTLRTVYVCKGDPSSADCASSGASVLWSADFASSVALTLGGASVTASSETTVGLNNRGLPTTGAMLTYTLARGASANDATGSLL